MDANTLPVYNEKDTTPFATPTTPTCTHNPQATPRLSSLIASPKINTHLVALTHALTTATQEGACLKCTTETVSQTLTALMVDLRAAKKEGTWTREEKWALKGEVKGLLKDVKNDVKSNWRKEDSNVRTVRRGWYWKR